MKSLCLTFLISVSVYAQKDSAEAKRLAKDPVKAQYLSVLNTLVPSCAGIGLALHAGDWNTQSYYGVSLMAYGLVAGPSIGHFYSSNHAAAWKGIIFRGGAALLLTAGGQYVLASPILAVAVISIGGGFIIKSAINDMRTARKSAEAYNKKHGLTFSPVFNPGEKVAGLQLLYVLH